MRGSCVAFAIVSATEMQQAKDTNKWVNLSEQSFYNRMAFLWEQSSAVWGWCRHHFHLQHLGQPELQLCL